MMDTRGFLPPHVRLLLQYRDLGHPLHIVSDAGRVPYFEPGRALLVIGDDRGGVSGSLGPAAFDGVRLRRWLAAMDEGRGVIGIFAGGVSQVAYSSVAGVATVLRAGGVIVECHDATWVEWSRYAMQYAPRTVRLDVVPEAIEREARAHVLSEGATPVILG